jgi:hypothetical protein
VRSLNHNFKKFVVTGSSSGIGQALRLRYEESPELFGGELIFDLKDWRLGSELSSKFDDCLIIHLAHDRTSSFSENIAATQKLAKNIRAGSIFLSTTSAHSQSKSKYGKSKYHIEEIFINRRAAVVKSGLICSKNPTAMLKTLDTLVARLPIIPLPFRGTSPFHLTDQSSLVTLIMQLTHDSDNLTYRAFSNQAITFKQLLEDLASKQGTTRYFFELPSPLSSVLIRFFTKFLGKFSFSDSLNSLVNQPDLYELLQLSDGGVDFPPNPHLIKYT